jgi:hypothetical protein
MREQDAPKPSFHLKPVYTPLPSQKGARNAETEKAARTDGPQGVRPQNEDDDLYDPYSDFHDGTLRPMEHVEDPWR